MSKKKTSKKKHAPPPRSSGCPAFLQAIATWVRVNQNRIYIAVIITCLSITVIYKILEYEGLA